MSAFRRRLSFATPFVVVLGCGGSHPHDNPPGPEVAGSKWNVWMSEGECLASEPMGSCPEGAMCNPPPPSNIDCPPTMKEGEHAQVLEREDHTCAVIPTGCTDLSCVTQATPCPYGLGTPKKLKGPFWTLTVVGDDNCVARAETCPPTDQSCAQAIECPLEANVTRVMLYRGKCRNAPPACEDESCEGLTTTCPMPVGKDLGALKWTGERSKDTCTVKSTGPIEGEHTEKIPCPADPKGGAYFQISRENIRTECTYRAGTYYAVVPCPIGTPPISK